MGLQLPFPEALEPVGQESPMPVGTSILVLLRLLSVVPTSSITQ